MRTTEGQEPAPKRRNLAESVLSVAASRATMLGAVAVTSIVITRLLGPAGIGTYAISAALLYMLTILCELGVSQGTAYFVGRREWDGAPMVRGVISLCAGVGAAGALLGAGLYALWGDLVPGLTWPMAIALLLALPFSLLWRIGPQVALAKERFELFALFDASPWLLACVLSIGLAIVADTPGAVIGYAAAVMLSGAFVAGWLVRAQGAGERSSSPPGGVRDIASFGSRVWLSELLIQINLRADLVLLGGFAGAAEGGVYSIALSTTAIAWALTEAFAISALPRSARIHGPDETSRPEERALSDSRVLRHAVLVIPAVLVLELVLLFVGIPLLYGSEFDRSITLGLILLPGSLLLGVGRTAAAILLGRGLAQRVLWIGLATAPATVAAYLLVVPSSGATGVAIVSSCSYFAYSVLAIIMLRAAMRVPIADLVRPRSVDLADYGAMVRRVGQYARDFGPTPSLGRRHR